MEMQYFKHYSHALGRDMECKVYGHGGKPVLFIPCQDGRFVDFEGFQMTDTWAPWIESGQVMVLSVDTVDKETWSNKDGDPHLRILRHEQWVRYIVDEAVPFIRTMAAERNGFSHEGVMIFGCSLGASHAANLYLRFPDHFDRLLAISGIYTSEYGFGGYMDGEVYQNSPVHYMANLPADHPFVEKLNRNYGIICTGQGPWEQPATSYRLRDIFAEKGIHSIWVDLWGHDVNHDWPWWHKMVPYFLPKLLG